MLPSAKALLEQRAERQAYTLLALTTSFTGCLLQEGIPLSVDAVSPKGDNMTLWGKQIYDVRTWKKFLVARTPDLSSISLSDQVQPLAEEYQAWILEATRFHVLTSQEHLDWLGRVVRLVVSWRLLEHKAEAATTGGGPPFADPWVQVHMALRALRHTLIQECAHLIHHAVKHKDEEERTLLEKHLHAVLARVALAQVPLPSGLLQESEGSQLLDEAFKEGNQDE